MKPRLMQWTWVGAAMVPTARFARMAAQEFESGHDYVMEVQEVRSAASHRHYFAVVHEAWMNLPEKVAEQFPSSEHLRKRALVQAGFSEDRSIVAPTRKMAREVGALVRFSDPFAVIVIHGTAVHVRTAKSQSTRAMGAAEFKRSKAAVLEILAQQVGVSVDDLASQAGGPRHVRRKAAGGHGEDPIATTGEAAKSTSKAPDRAKEAAEP